MLSQRNLERLVSRCAEYEFEDIICDVDEVELLAPGPNRWFVISQKVANRLARYSIPYFNPGLGKLKIRGNYDLFVVICQIPRDLLVLNAIEGWRQRCRTSVCWIAEIWACELRRWRGHLKILSKFDYVVTPCSGSVRPVQDVIQRPCLTIPPGIDAIQFCPRYNAPLRQVDVYSIGRKSTVTHQSLLKMAEQKGIFYIYDTYDTLRSWQTQSYKHHRSLIANIAKRSRYFIANAPKIDRKAETCGQNEISYRFFEGAASGTIMIGDPPKNEDFRKHFDWPDAVIRVPFGTADVAEVIADLDSNPDRLKKIRKNNVIQSLLRHDWVYRWRAILDIVGLEPKPALIAREKHLKKLAGDVEKDLYELG